MTQFIFFNLNQICEERSVRNIHWKSYILFRKAKMQNGLHSVFLNWKLSQNYDEQHGENWKCEQRKILFILDEFPGFCEYGASLDNSSNEHTLH